MSKLQISSLSDKKFLVGISVHEDKLMRLWKNLRNDNLKERKTMQWVDIGFQGKDPSTDFRGAGMLGLEQLLAITDHGSDYRKEALEMY
jgi:ELMO domain-containing protein